MTLREILFFELIVACTLITLMLYGCVHEKIEEVAQNPYETLVNNSVPVTIINRTSVYKEFELVINKKSFYSSSADIIRDGMMRYGDVRDTTGFSLIRSIWLNTAFKVMHNSPFTEKRWQHNPILFLNSVGNGLCDDVASVNEALWRYANFPARTWYLDGHVVSEVYHGGKWKMFDADMGFYCEVNDTILSVTEIGERDGILLDKKFRRSAMEFDPQLRPISDSWYWDGTDWNYITDIWKKFKYIDHYKPKEDSAIYSYRLELPPGAQYTFGKDLTPLPTPFNYPSPNLYNLIFKSEQLNDHTINLFLVPVNISGNGYVQLNGQRYRLEELERDFFHQSETLISQIYVEDVTEIEISYMVNGYVFDLYEKPGEELKYSLSLHGTDLAGLDISTQH
jgi:hypothetical protein